jgi:plastocyanin domain-containing protein
MNKIVLIIITLGLIATLGIIFTSGTKSAQSVLIRDGVQYITIDAKGGYSPQTTEAQAGIPTKLIVKTNDTYDCSATLVIHSVGFQKILPQTGETEIDIGIPKAGVPLQGVCGMGMYNFEVDFS